MKRVPLLLILILLLISPFTALTHLLPEQGFGKAGLQLAGADYRSAAGGIASLLEEQDPIPDGFTTLIPLEPVPGVYDGTKGKHQAKVFAHADKHWAVFADTSGTHLWRLDNTRWTNVFTLTTRMGWADCLVTGNVAHILLFAGNRAELYSLEYVAESDTYQPWSQRSAKVEISLDEEAETASLGLDGQGRLWLASDAATQINVRYSDPPYTDWSAPMPLATDLDPDDVGALVYIPALRQIGLFWSDQQTQRFGFRTHADEADPADWSTNEVPASESALDIGRGMADDHFSLKAAADGTLYCAIKTSYDTDEQPRIALLVRRPTGAWDKSYEVSQKGTAPIVILNEAQEKIRVIYTSQTYGGDILYKESAMTNIAFGPELILIPGVHNYATASHQNLSGQVVILASNRQHTVGVLAIDADRVNEISPGRTPNADFVVSPNPFSTKTTVRFLLPPGQDYSLHLYDGSKGQLVYHVQGISRSTEWIAIEIDGSRFSQGLYVVRLQTKEGVKSQRLLLSR